MTSRPPHYNRYKIESKFGTDTVTHQTFKTDLRTGQRRIMVETTWVRGRKLGTGTFREVYLEQEQESGELRAVKVISRAHVKIQEMQSLIDLRDHPALFTVFFGWFENPYAVHIAMEYIEYGNLSEYIHQHGAHAKADARKITSQLLEGLVVLHEREICHRDLKPQNILIASPSPIWVKITDFGLSKNWGESPLETPCGTLIYQAPELRGLLPEPLRINNVPFTKSVDLWALGAIIHELLTSEIPFYTKRLPMLNPSNSNNWYFDTDHMYNYCRGYTFPLEALQDHEASPEEIDLITGLMAPNPSDRVSAAAALESEWFTKIVDSDTGLPALLPWSTVVVDSGIGQGTLTPCSNQQTLYPDPNMTIRGVSRATGSPSHSFENQVPDQAVPDDTDQTKPEDPSDQKKLEDPEQAISGHSDQGKPDESAQATLDDSVLMKPDDFDQTKLEFPEQKKPEDPDQAISEYSDQVKLDDSIPTKLEHSEQAKLEDPNQTKPKASDQKNADYSILTKPEHSEQAKLEDPNQTKPEESDQNNADNSDQTKPENSNQAKTEEAGPLNGASVSYSWTGWFW